MEFTRYAIFHTPTGALGNFGAAWLGWDSARGVAPDAPDVQGLPLARNRLTRKPRKYGFHATLKPPFCLAPGQSQAALETALERFSATRPPVVIDQLQLAIFGGFLAIIPARLNPSVHDLAADTLRQFDLFRAPMSAEELARRRAANLTAAQDAHLLQWGYPYVLDQFRFHMTLTGFLGPDAIAAQAALAPHITPLIPTPYTIDHITLMGERADGKVCQIRRFTLAQALRPAK